MGSVVVQLSNAKQLHRKCLDVVKEEKGRTRPSLVHPGLDFNSQLEGFIDCCAKETMLNELVQELQFIWLQSWNTLQRKVLNLQVMLLGTTRKQGSPTSACSEALSRLISYWLRSFWTASYLASASSALFLASLSLAVRSCILISSWLALFSSILFILDESSAAVPALSSFSLQMLFFFLIASILR